MESYKNQIDSQIPEDVCIEILQLLPVKSLMRFMCISQQWRSTIHDQIIREELLLASPSSIQSIEFTESEIKAVTNLAQFPFKQKLDIVGSANGLVLCVDTKNRDLILFNPLTQWHTTIQFLSNGNPDSRVYGFCYDQSQDDHTIVIMDRNRYNGDTWIQTWSSRTHNWVKAYIQTNPSSWNFALRLGLFVKGALYWTLVDSSRYSAFRFDSDSRKLNIIKSPVSINSTLYFEIVGLGDCVALVSYDSLVTHVWELNDVYEFGSWTKIMTIPVVSPHGVGYFLTPLFRFQNGEDVLVTRCCRDERCTFYLFDRCTKALTRLKIEGVGGLQHVKRIPYKKTLVSISDSDAHPPIFLSPPSVADPPYPNFPNVLDDL